MDSDFSSGYPIVNTYDLVLRYSGLSKFQVPIERPLKQTLARRRIRRAGRMTTLAAPSPLDAYRTNVAKGRTLSA